MTQIVAELSAVKRCLDRGWINNIPCTGDRCMQLHRQGDSITRCCASLIKIYMLILFWDRFFAGKHSNNEKQTISFLDSSNVVCVPNLTFQFFL